jgi:hypothetical protein
VLAKADAGALHLVGSVRSPFLPSHTSA